MTRTVTCALLLVAACNSGGGSGGGVGLPQGEALLQQLGTCAVARVGELLVVLQRLGDALADPSSVPGVVPTGPGSFDFSFGVDLDGDSGTDATLMGSVAFAAFPPAEGTTATLTYELTGAASGNGAFDLVFGATEVTATGMGSSRGSDCVLDFDIDPADPLRFPLPAPLAGLPVAPPAGAFFATLTMGGNKLTARVGFPGRGIVSIAGAALNGVPPPTTTFSAPIAFVSLPDFLRLAGCGSRLLRYHAAILAKAGEVFTAADPADYATLSPDPLDPTIVQFETQVDLDGDGATDGTLRGKLNNGRLDLFVSPPAPGEPAPPAFVSRDGNVFSQSLGATLLGLGDDCIIVNTGGGGLRVTDPLSGTECTAIFSILPNTPDFVIDTDGLHDLPGEPRVTDVIGSLNRIGLTFFRIQPDDTRTEVAAMSGPVSYASETNEVTFYPISGSVEGGNLDLGEFTVPIDGT